WIQISRQLSRGGKTPARPSSTEPGGNVPRRLASKVRTDTNDLGGAGEQPSWILLPEDRDRAVLAAAGPTLALLGRSAHRRVPDRPGAGGRAAARAARTSPGRPRRGGAHLGRLAVLRRRRRGTP